MRAVFLMFDSLNRHLLAPYGCDWTRTSNFRRLAEKTVTFDRAYCGSMPCMPARREIHTGRYNFLHMSWGGLESFDDSMPRTLQKSGVHTHLASDHYHYWEGNACTYHTQYGTWEFFRGQEGDPWIGQVADPTIPPNINKRGGRQDWVNRLYTTKESDWSMVQTVEAGLSFIDRNRNEDKWFLQIECFDPHEPFYVPERYKELYGDLAKDYDGPLFDWPQYAPVSESPEEIEVLRKNYASLLSMCDAYLGKVLDMFDEHDLWKDTMLIVGTDHGFLLGEHGWWAKNHPPWWEELSHLPLFIFDPRCPQTAGQRRDHFVQTIDLAPTLLSFFGLDPMPDMMGQDLSRTISDNSPAREAGLFGAFGHFVSVTDGRRVYMRAPVREDNQPLSRYTLFPYGVTQTDLTLHEPFTFTKGMPVLRIPAGKAASRAHEWGHLLYDLDSDPQQMNPLKDARLESEMTEVLTALMKANDAPPEQYQRLGLD